MPPSCDQPDRSWSITSGADVAARHEHDAGRAVHAPSHVTVAALDEPVAAPSHAQSVWDPTAQRAQRPLSALGARRGLGVGSLGGGRASPAGLRNTSPVGAGAPSSSRTSGYRREQRLHGDPRLEAGEVHPDAHVRPGGERQVPLGVGTVDVEAVGIGERRRVAVGAGQRDDHEVAGGDRRAGEVDVAGRVAVDDGGRRLEPQRLLDDALGERRVGDDRAARPPRRGAGTTAR